MVGCRNLFEGANTTGLFLYYFFFSSFLLLSAFLSFLLLLSLLFFLLLLLLVVFLLVAVSPSSDHLLPRGVAEAQVGGRCIEAGVPQGRGTDNDFVSGRECQHDSQELYTWQETAALHSSTLAPPRFSLNSCSRAREVQ